MKLNTGKTKIKRKTHQALAKFKKKGGGESRYWELIVQKDIGKFITMKK